MSLASLVRPAVVTFLALTVATGVVYPLAVTGVARVVFPDQAAGSLVMKDGRAIGSTLIGQSFTDPGHFWGRPSATTPMAYNAANSAGSNLGPTNPALVDAVKGRVAALRAADPGNTAPVPVDLVTTSASGFDPEISLAAARYQAGRVARERHLAPDVVEALVARHARGRLLGLLGEERVNVLELNLDLDRTAAR